MEKDLCILAEEASSDSKSNDEDEIGDGGNDQVSSSGPDSMSKQASIDSDIPNCVPYYTQEQNNNNNDLYKPLQMLLEAVAEIWDSLNFVN